MLHQKSLFPGQGNSFTIFRCTQSLSGIKIPLYSKKILKNFCPVFNSFGLVTWKKLQRTAENDNVKNLKILINSLSNAINNNRHAWVSFQIFVNSLFLYALDLRATLIVYGRVKPDKRNREMPR